MLIRASYNALRNIWMCIYNIEELIDLRKATILGEGNNMYRLMPGTVAYSKGKIYISDLQSNGLYVVEDLNFQNARLVCHFDGEKSIIRDLFTSAVLIDTDVLWIPHSGSNLYLHNTRTDCLDKVKTPKDLVCGGGAFKTALKSEKGVYLLGYCNNDIWIYKKKEGTKKKIEVPNGKGLYMGGCFLDGCLYIVSKASSHILRIDCITNEVTIVDTDNVEGYADIGCVGSRLLLVGFDSGNLYELKDNELLLLKERIGNFKDWPHGGIVTDSSGKLYILSRMRDELIIHDTNEDSFKKVIISDGFNEDLSMAKPIIVDDDIVFWSYGCNCIWVYHIDSEVLEKHVLYSSYVPKIDREKNDIAVFYEDSIWKLDSFIKAL